MNRISYFFEATNLNIEFHLIKFLSFRKISSSICDFISNLTLVSSFKLRFNCHDEKNFKQKPQLKVQPVLQIKDTNYEIL